MKQKIKDDQMLREKEELRERAEAEGRKNTKILRENTNKRMIE